MTDEELPVVLFVCVHNAGRSQMAAAFLTQLAAGRLRVHNAGTEPASEIHPVVTRVMREAGIELAGRRPKRLTDQAVVEADVVITMGCGDACPVYPGKRYEDWDVHDPAGSSVEEVRKIRDDIRGRVESLLSEIDEKPR